jgi:glycosyltransferase involved in cell wall biosynthesis
VRLSIVIPSVNGDAALQDCLASLRQQSSATEMEIIVVTAEDRKITDVNVVRVEKGASLCEMRAAGVRRASGSHIAFLGDRYRVSPGWIEAARKDREFDATGGAVAPSPTLSFLGWCVYLAEYAHVSPPIEKGATIDAKALPGGNVVYRAELFERADLARRNNELEFHAKLLAAGAKLGSDPELEVQFTCEPGFAAYLAERFQFSGALARERARGVGSTLLYAAIALLLPAIVPVQAALAVFRKKKYRLRFLASAPVIFLFGVVQTAGELAVYARLK